MKIAWCIVFLSYAYHCYGRSLHQATETVPTVVEKADRKIKSGYFKIPKTKREVKMHDIIHQLKGAVLENHVNSDDIRTRRKRDSTNYETAESYSKEEEYCAPRYNLGSSVYHKDVTIGEGGSVVNIGNLYMYQYSPNGEYQRQVPIPGYNFPIISDDKYPAKMEE